MLRNLRLEQDYVNAVMEFLSQGACIISGAASCAGSFDRRTAIWLRVNWKEAGGPSAILKRAAGHLRCPAPNSGS